MLEGGPGRETCSFILIKRTVSVYEMQQIYSVGVDTSLHHLHIADTCQCMHMSPRKVANVCSLLIASVCPPFPQVNLGYDGANLTRRRNASTECALQKHQSLGNI